MKSLKKVLATASAAQQASGRVNYETINGFLTGSRALANAPVVPVQLRGAVNTRGSINLGGNSSVSPIRTIKGTLTVQHGNPSPPPKLNYRTCRETETISTGYTVLGNRSSGVFRGARGNGHAVVVFSAIAPRYTSGPHKGQCNFSSNAQPKPNGAYISFQAQGPLYVR